MIDAIAYVKRYAIAFAVAIALHLLLFGSLQVALDTFASDTSKSLLEPKPLKARLIRFKPQSVAPTIAPATPEVSNIAPAEPKDATEPEESFESEKEQLERLKVQREERLAELRDRAFRTEIGEELTAEMTDAIQDVSQVYITGIYLAVVENWSRPPSARNNMSAIVLVELFPSGDLNSVGIIESSGNAAFDRSAELAVRRAAPFVVPEDLALFESQFRSFRLNFRPSDLLR